MWPFGKKKVKARVEPTMAPQAFLEQPVSFSQVDTTEGFDDHVGLSASDWIDTQPLNASVEGPELMGLPPKAATPDQVYSIARELSKIRESLPLDDDGVYCPVCHRASIDLSKLRKPCPSCGRELLQFGWS